MFWLFWIEAGRWCHIWRVSIHPMFWLFISKKESSKSTEDVSIHPMFWLFSLYRKLKRRWKRVSIHPMFWLFSWLWEALFITVVWFQYILCSGCSKKNRGFWISQKAQIAHCMQLFVTFFQSNYANTKFSKNIFLCPYFTIFFLNLHKRG